ncbi:MAG: cation:proton antiporter, partial [Acidimicrobiia bacterium]
MGWSLIALGTILVVVALADRCMSTSSVTGPLVFTAAGVLIGPEVFGVADLSLDDSGIETLLTLTLALVLFVDATHINLSALRRQWADPVRLLLLAFPLMLVLGFGLGVVLLGGLSIFAVAAISTILAPTDAALGQAVVTSEQVPLGVRQTLSVESGLNDGLALPILIAVLAVARA